MIVGSESRAWPGARRVAVCASDLGAAGRIRRALTAAGHEVAGTFAGLPALIEDFPRLDAELVVAMLHPARDAGHLARFRQRLDGVPLVAVVPTLHGPDSHRLLAADIDGLVLKDELEQVLAPAIASALSDQLCVPSDALPVLAGPVFSHREKQVLELLLAGLTNSEIAGQLFLSESTVKSHLSSSFRKLGVSSRAEVLRQARSANPAIRLPVTAPRAAAAPLLINSPGRPGQTPVRLRTPCAGGP